nr:MAG TPA: hypothetical protein [Caudoviricetes sp.]
MVGKGKGELTGPQFFFAQTQFAERGNRAVQLSLF